MSNQSKLPSSGASRSKQSRWTTVAIYVGLLLLVAWLNYSPSKDVSRTGSNSSGDSPAPSRSDSDHKRQTVEDSRGEQRPNLESGAGPAHQGASDGSSERSPGRDDGRDEALVVHNVRVIDEDGRTVYRGDVNLVPTLSRIERGVRLRFSHDGIVFENREHRLPAKPSGYYHEYVQPTPGVDGPGAQRVVLGRDGEVYYSADHYRTFRRIR